MAVAYSRFFPIKIESIKSDFKLQEGVTVWWPCTIESRNPLSSGGVVLVSGKVLYHNMINYVAQRGELEFFTGQSFFIKTDHDEQLNH